MTASESDHGQQGQGQSHRKSKKDIGGTGKSNGGGWGNAVTSSWLAVGFHKDYYNRDLFPAPKPPVFQKTKSRNRIWKTTSQRVTLRAGDKAWWIRGLPGTCGSLSLDPSTHIKNEMWWNTSLYYQDGAGDRTECPWGWLTSQARRPDELQTQWETLSLKKISARDWERHMSTCTRMSKNDTCPHAHVWILYTYAQL